jgi:hypothetical protein
MASSDEAKKEDRPIRGLIVDSTPGGMSKKQFKGMLDKANELHADGLLLAGCVQLADNEVGLVFVRVSAKPKAPPREAAVLTDDDDGGFPWPNQ